MPRLPILRSVAPVVAFFFALGAAAPIASAAKLKGKINEVTGVRGESKLVATSKKKGKKKLSVSFLCKKIKREEGDPSCPKKRFSATIKRDPEEEFHYIGKAKIGRDKCGVDAYAYSQVLMATITCGSAIYSLRVEGKDREDDDRR